MNILRNFAYKLIFHKTSESIPIDIHLKEPDNCYICHTEILPQLTKPITILPCKHIFHHNCIINRDSSQLLCPICEMATKPSQTSFMADILGENLQISSLEKSQESSVE